MRLIHEVRFFFAGWNFGLLFFLLGVAAIFVTCSLNVPVGTPQEFTAEVLEIGMTNSSGYDASKASARVRLPDGLEANVVLPRNVMFRPGESIVVLKQPLFLSGSVYQYGGTTNAQ